MIAEHLCRAATGARGTRRRPTRREIWGAEPGRGTLSRYGDWTPL